MIGCLRGGVYGDRSTENVIHRGGTPDHRVVITSYPGETATIKGILDVASRADYVTMSHVAIDTAGAFANGELAPMGIWGRNFILEDSDVTNHDQGASGVMIEADDVVIRRNRIHDVGTAFGHDHGIYVADSRGFVIDRNWIYHNRVGWGIQLYPRAREGTVVGNVIDGCGSGLIISGDVGPTSHGNRIERNVISNSIGLGGFNSGTAIAGWLPPGDRSPNTVSHNLFWNNRGGDFDRFRGTAYSASGNVRGNPRYANRGDGDYRVRSRVALALGA